MKVTEIMKTAYLCFDSGDSVYEVLMQLDAGDLRGAPVVQRGKYLGMITLSGIAKELRQRKVLENLTPVLAAKCRDVKIGARVFNPIFARTFIGPEATLAQAMSSLAERNFEFIPVVGKGKKRLGVVFASDLRAEMLRAISLGIKKKAGKEEKEEKKEGKTEEPIKIRDKRMDTMIDDVLEFVNERRLVSAEDVSREFKISEQTVEEYAQSLEKHKLLEVEYTMFGKMKLKAVD